MLEFTGCYFPDILKNISGKYKHLNNFKPFSLLMYISFLI